MCAFWKENGVRGCGGGGDVAGGGDVRWEEEWEGGGTCRVWMGDFGGL